MSGAPERRPAPPAAAAPAEAQALMLAFQAGDDAAFDRLVAATKHEVFALAFRYGLDEGRADDVAQETFLRVFRSRKTYRPTARFRSWLLRIAANLVVSAARARRRVRVRQSALTAMGAARCARGGVLLLLP